MKNMTNRLSLVRLFNILLLTVWIAASGSAFAQSANTESSYNETMKLALKANEKVLLLEHQWTTVPELLKKAKAAANRKDFGSANNYAAEALVHAELGIEQAQQQAQRWVNAVPR